MLYDMLPSVFMTVHVPLIIIIIIFFFFIFFKILSLGRAFDEGATAMALEGVQKKSDTGDNCENSVCSLTVHKKSLAFDGRE